MITGVSDAGHAAYRHLSRSRSTSAPSANPPLFAQERPIFFFPAMTVNDRAPRGHSWHASKVSPISRAATLWQSDCNGSQNVGSPSEASVAGRRNMFQPRLLEVAAELFGSVNGDSSCQHRTPAGRWRRGSPSSHAVIVSGIPLAVPSIGNRRSGNVRMDDFCQGANTGIRIVSSERPTLASSTRLAIRR